MSRDCTDKPIFINEDFEDPTFITYYRACQQDLCNGGSGKGSNNWGLRPDIGPEGILLVEGVGNEGASLKCNILLVSMLALASLQWR